MHINIFNVLRRSDFVTVEHVFGYTEEWRPRKAGLQTASPSGVILRKRARGNSWGWECPPVLSYAEPTVLLGTESTVHLPLSQPTAHTHIPCTHMVAAGICTHKQAHPNIHILTWRHTCADSCAYLHTHPQLLVIFSLGALHSQLWVPAPCLVHAHLLGSQG